MKSKVALKIFISFYLHLCFCVSLCAPCTCRFLQRPEGVGSPGTGETSWDPLQDRKCSSWSSHLSSPKVALLKELINLLKDRLSLCSLDWPGTHHGAQASLQCAAIPFPLSTSSTGMAGIHCPAWLTAAAFGSNPHRGRGT